MWSCLHVNAKCKLSFGQKEVLHKPTQAILLKPSRQHFPRNNSQARAEVKARKRRTEMHCKVNKLAVVCHLDSQRLQILNYNKHVHAKINTHLCDNSAKKDILAKLPPSLAAL